jgi:uncharacterized damage-inducible protein DinB
MSIKVQYKTLFAYHWHTSRRILEGAAQLEEADLRAGSIYAGRSIIFLLFHVLHNDRIWRQVLELGRLSAILQPEDFQDLAALQAGYQAEQQGWQVLLEALSPDEIDADCEMASASDQVYSLPRWWALQHVILHGMQHHAELAQLLTEHGHSPGDIDFIFYQP